MKKRDVLSLLSEVCDNHFISRERVTIVGGAASLLNNLITETDDVDVMVDERTSDNLWWTKGVTQEEELPPCGYFSPSIHYTMKKISFIYNGCAPKYPTFKHRQFNVLTNLGLLQYRIDLGRDKDWTDVLTLIPFWGELDETYKLRLKELQEKQGYKHD